MLHFIKELKDRFHKIFISNLYKNTFMKFGKNSFITKGIKLIGAKNISIGNNVYISEYGWLNANKKNSNQEPSLEIGDNTYIGRMVQINAWNKVVIQESVLIADRVFISDADHNYSNKDKPIIEQGDKFVGNVLIKSG